MKQYNIYIGHNDKDAKKQLLSDETIILTIQDTLEANGLLYYTMFNCFGCYEGEREKTTRIEIIETEGIEINYISSINKSIAALKRLLGQECILLSIHNIKASFE